MKKQVLLLTSVFLLSTAAGAVTADVTVSPDATLWQSESFELNATCEPTGNTYTVYIENITRGDNQAHAGPDSALTFSKVSNTNAEYVLDGSVVKQFLNDRYGYKPGEYTFFTACDAQNATETVKQTFTVETLALTIASGLDRSAYYAGSTANVSLTLKRKGEGSPTIIGGDSTPRPSFTLTANGENTEVSPYYSGNERVWVLNTAVPDQPGTHTVTITAHHDGATTMVSRDITVQNTLQFDAQLGTQNVHPGQTVDIALSATYEGDTLSLSKDDLEITADGADITDRVTMTDESTASVTLPDLNPGVYDLKITLARDGVPAATEQFTLRYPIQLTGDLSDHTGNPLAYDITVSDGDTQVQTSGNGDYQVQIVPGTYNVTLAVQDTRLMLRDVTVSSWDDPIRVHPYDAKRLPGLRLAGLYSYQTALTYDSAELSLPYDSGVVDNPKQLGVYHCAGWNAETMTCYGSWTELSAERDTVNNRMQLETAGEGAYAIGRRTALGVTYAANKIKATYKPDEQIDLSGRIKTPAGNTVPNATVTVDVADADASARTWTDDSGRFSLSLGVPEEAGEYTLDITASKPPYRDGSTSTDFSVKRPAQINIVAPESVTIQANTTKNISVYVENTGYRTIDDLQPVTTKIPFFDRIRFDDRPLQPGQSRSAPVTVAIPADADAKTHTAELRFSYKDTSTSAVFGLTVEAVEQTTTTTTNNSTTATASGMLTGGVPSIPSPSAMAGAVPSVSLPFADLILLIIALQIGVVLIVVVKGRISLGDRRRDHVLQAVSTVKEDVGQAVHGQEPDDTAAGRAHGRQDGMERDNVMRAMQHIKDQIAAER